MQLTQSSAAIAAMNFRRGSAVLTITLFFLAFQATFSVFFAILGAAAGIVVCAGIVIAIAVGMACSIVKAVRTA